MTQVSDPPCPARRYGYANRAGFGALRFQKGVCPSQFHGIFIFIFFALKRTFIYSSSIFSLKQGLQDDQDLLLP